MFPVNHPLLGALVVLVGWIWGSFLNQLIDRTPFNPFAVNQDKKGPPKGTTLLSPKRSVCFACGCLIPWYHNIPLFSYLWLKGRCRGCGFSIGVRTLVVEAITPLLFLGIHLAFRAEILPGGAIPWVYLGASWALVAGFIAWEKRRFSRWFLAAGVVLVLSGFLAGF